MRGPRTWGAVPWLVTGLSLMGVPSATAAGGTVQDLGSFGNATRTYDINAQGQVVGGAKSSITHGTHPFEWTGSRLRDLGSLADTSEALGINDAGQAFGYYLSYAPGGGLGGFFWDGSHQRDIGSLDSNWAQPADMNQRGQITGNAALPGSGLSTHAFRWTPGTGGSTGDLRIYR